MSSPRNQKSKPGDLGPTLDYMRAEERKLEARREYYNEQDATDLIGEATGLSQLVEAHLLELVVAFLAIIFFGPIILKMLGAR